MKQQLRYTDIQLSIKSYDMLKDFHLHLQNVYAQHYQTAYGCLWAPADITTIQHILYEASVKQQLSPEVIFVVGIGGSYLGTKAVYDALQLTVPIKVPIIFIDTFDPLDLLHAKEIIQHHAHQQKNVLVICATKSGTTLETVVNFQVLLDIMKTVYVHRWQELVVVISDVNSSLTAWAHEHGCLALSIPSLVGGRFSVFSAVGLFPLAVAGIDIMQLCTGAREYTERAFTQANHTSVQSAQCIYQQYQQGITIYDLFLFDKRLESIGKWYRQLFAESLGKEQEDGNKIKLVPTVSIGTLELHSVAQLMLGAQPPVITTFIMVDHIKNDIRVKSDGNFYSPGHDTTVHTLMNRAAMATQKAYEVVGLSYDVLRLPEVTPYYIGQLLQLYMMQVLYLSQLMQVNPFDQPHVELYKTIMRQME